MGNRISITRLIALAAAAAVSAPAFAADMDPVVYTDDANYVTSAELGSGWYIRGDIGLNLTGSHDVSKYGNPAQTLFYDNNITDAYSFSVGAGYQLNRFLRLEANVGRVAGADYSRSQLMYEAGNEPPGTDPRYIVDIDIPDGIDATDTYDPIACNGWGEYVNTSTGVEYLDNDFITNCISRDTVEYDATYAMVSAYVDLPGMWGLTPFVGGGVGVGRISWREEIGAIDCVPREESVRAEGCRAYGTTEQPAPNAPYSQPGTVNDGVGYRLGWEVGGGVAYDLSSNTKIEAAYKYKNFGGSKINSLSTGSGLNAGGFGVHQVNVGMRYSFF